MSLCQSGSTAVACLPFSLGGTCSSAEAPGPTLGAVSLWAVSTNRVSPGRPWSRSCTCKWCCSTGLRNTEVLCQTTKDVCFGRRTCKPPAALLHSPVPMACASGTPLAWPGGVLFTATSQPDLSVARLTAKLEINFRSSGGVR